MKDFLAKLPLDEWREPAEELLKNSFLEEAWVDTSMQILGGQFSGSSDVEVVIQLRSADYRFVCDSCTGRFCSHATSLVEFYLQDSSSFMSTECSNRLINLLVKKSWIKYEQPVRKRNLRSLKRKLEMMHEGLGVAHELYSRVFQLLPKVNSQEELFSLREQVERLGEYHLNGLAGEFKKVISSNEQSTLSSLVRLREGISSAKRILTTQLASESVEYLDSEVYALIGHIWKTDELTRIHSPEAGQFLQLAFHCEENNYLERLEDTAIWLNLLNGQVCHSVNLRPYKSLRHLKAEDSSDMVLECHEFFRYPGNNNFRVRWQSVFTRKEIANDYEIAVNNSRADWKEVIKESKKHLQNPFKTSPLLFLLRFKNIAFYEHKVFLKNEFGYSVEIVSENSGYLLSVLRTLPGTALENGACLVQAKRTEKGNGIAFKPLTIVSSSQKIRLTI